MRKLVLARVMALVVAAGAVGVVSVAPATTALAATCRTIGMSYEDEGNPDFGGGGILARTENDPVDGPFSDVAKSAPNQEIDVVLGGNGLVPGSKPRWEVFSSNGQDIGTLTGHTTHSNCVSDEVTYPLFGGPGDQYLIKATYVGGNDHTQITNQNLVRVTFLSS
jgi:hypothetical protein